MPKGKNEDEVLELKLGKDGVEEVQSDEDADLDEETTFDDLNPRFSQKLDAAIKDEQDDEEDLDSTDDLEDEADPADDLDTEFAADDADPADEDADEPAPGKKLTPLQKRIQRANRLADEAREESRLLRERLDERERKDELAASTSKFEAYKRDTERKIEDLRAKKVQAIENGETSEQARLDDEINDLRADLRYETRKHEDAKAELEKAATRRGASPITLTKVAQWKRRNQLYGKNPAFTAAVNGIDGQLTAAGSNPESDEHYERLDRQLKKHFPQFYKKRPAPRRHPSDQTPREGSPGQRRRIEQGRPQIRNGRLQVPKSELTRIKANMVKFGMDPNDPKDVKEYLQNNR